MILIENEKQDGMFGMLIEDAPDDLITHEVETITKEIEVPIVNETEFQNLKNNSNFKINEATKSLILESTGEKYHIKGVYSQADKMLRNPRIYKRDLLEREKSKFETNQLARKKGWGEAEHPTDRSHIVIDRLSHRTLSLEWNGNDLIGDSVLIEGHPYGDMCIAIAKEGGQLSVSSRGVGSVMRNYVQENFSLKCWDVVLFPSADSALEMVKENEEILLRNGVTSEAIDIAKKSIKENSNMSSKEYGESVVNIFSELIKMCNHTIFTESDDENLKKFNEYKRINKLWLKTKFNESDENDYENFCFGKFRKCYL